jgi:transcriptional regulator with XRE-family HTH domain
MPKAVDVTERFAENLVRHRHARGLAQQALADRASMHRTEVSLLERGRRVPRIDTAAKLAAALSVDISALLEGIAWVPSPGGGRFVIADRH